MEEQFEKLQSLNHRIHAISTAMGLLAWDRDVSMPPGAAENRGATLSQLGGMAHEMAISEQMGGLIENLLPWSEDHETDSFEARYLAVSKRNYEQMTKIPTAMLMEFIQVTNAADQGWRQARQNSDFSVFQPHLEKIVELLLTSVEFFKPYDHPYDVLLDRFEPNMKTAEVQEIFAAIRPEQVELVHAILAANQIDDSCLHQPFEIDKQVALGEKLVALLGYDLSSGRQDPVEHPYMAHLGYGDTRITYRADPEFFNTYLSAAMHEAGHAMYEQGIPKSLWRTPLEGGASLALHESQSRLWENQVGRSLPFWEFFYPQVQAAFPSQLGNVPLNTFHRAINRVEPSMIRVEADEATYNLHIMLRLEVEIALIEGQLAVKDLPEAWNSRMEEYLGVTPSNDAEGVLQDVHWSSGMFGYFSTYALGNLVSVQLWENMLETHPNVDDDMRRGDFSNILGWMRENVHVHGSMFFPQDLMQRVTGTKIDGGPYLAYLDNKYRDLYGI
jgi:carboxypeptidase Taq